MGQSFGKIKFLSCGIVAVVATNTIKQEQLTMAQQVAMLEIQSCLGMLSAMEDKSSQEMERWMVECTKCPACWKCEKDKGNVVCLSIPRETVLPQWITVTRSDTKST